MIRKISLSFGLSLMLGMAAGSAFAQSTSGTIRGTVLDPSGALVARAEITITNADGFTRTLKSGATGTFQALHLAPGFYSVSVNAAGFTPALEGDIEVDDNKVRDEKITLGISVNQEIDVTTDRPEDKK
jgi:hypothetical protein